MKLQIVFKIKEDPTGGGNQFLRNLKEFFIKDNCYTETSDDAEAFIFNSYQYIDETIRLKLLYPNKLFIHRIDGPIKLYNKMNDRRDTIIYKSNQYIADGTVFQSSWSRMMNYQLGYKANTFESIIMNAPDERLFNRHTSLIKTDKIKLIAISWSSHQNKGFADYQWLDDNLDFDRIDMTLIGNTSISFKNIKHIPPLSTQKISEELKKYDIFITASKSDPCSNALLEAMHCGLPAISLNDGGHPEIVKDGGELFNHIQEVPELIDKIYNNLEAYRNNIKLPKMSQIGSQYLDFINQVFEQYQRHKYHPKKLSKLKLLGFKKEFLYWKITSKFDNLL